MGQTPYIGHLISEERNSIESPFVSSVFQLLPFIVSLYLIMTEKAPREQKEIIFIFMFFTVISAFTKLMQITKMAS